MENKAGGRDADGILRSTANPERASAHSGRRTEISRRITVVIINFRVRMVRSGDFPADSASSAK